MADESFTIDEYHALNRAIAQGALTVEYGDKKVTYRSLNEMFRIKNMIASELGLNKGRSNRRIAVFSKDWSCDERIG